MVYFRTVHLESHDKNDQTQKMAFGSTNFVEEITVCINNIILINMM